MYTGGDPGRPVSNLFLVLKMKVQRKVTLREVNFARAIRLIEGGMSQGVVDRQCNASRNPGNHCWKRYLNSESLKDKERSRHGHACGRHGKNLFLESHGQAPTDYALRKLNGKC